MNPINLTLDMPIKGNCDNCCFPSRHKHRKRKEDQKVQDIAKEKMDEIKDDKLR